MIYYKDIDTLPIYNWRMINKTNDLRFLLKKKAKEIDRKKLAKVWEKIYDSFLDTFGINDDFRRIMELKVEITLEKVQMSLDKDRFRLNFIKIKERELEAINSRTEKEGGVTFLEVKAHVSKYIGQYIDEKKVSVAEYYTYIELMKKDKTTQPNGGR